MVSSGIDVCREVPLTYSCSGHSAAISRLIEVVVTDAADGVACCPPLSASPPTKIEDAAGSRSIRVLAKEAAVPAGSTTAAGRLRPKARLEPT